MLLACGGCRVEVVAGVEAARDGSGAVRVGVGLDGEALAQVGDLAHQLRVDDLRRAGWQVTGPSGKRGGVTWVRASKRFSSPRQAERVVAELNGPAGPFRELRLTRHRSLLRTTTGLRGTVDLTSGARGFTDEEVQRRLGGQDLGLDPATLQRRLGVTLDRIFRVQVTARLPGSIISTNSPLHDGGVARWRPKVGERIEVNATASAWNTVSLALGVLGLAAAAAAGVLLVQRRADVPPS